MNSRDRFMATLRGEPVDHIPAVPISMIVAADLVGVPYRRYATDFREHVRGQIAFLETYRFDHVSAISDPATEAADCGAAVVYHEDAPPALDEQQSLLRDKETLRSLAVPDPALGKRMSNRLRVVEELARTVGQEVIVEGWVEGPVAEASDLRGINRLMMDFFDDPRFVTDLFEFVFEMEMRYARAQIEAGADVIGIGDAAASLVGPDLYREYVQPWHVRYIDEIHRMGALVRLHICGDSRFILPALPGLQPDIMDLDTPAPVEEARRHAGPQQVLTGNIDPVRVLRNGTPELVAGHLESCFLQAGRARYMVAAGCEIPRGTPAENIAALRSFAQEHTPQTG